MKCFEVLGLTSEATPGEVKAAWRSLASHAHPDKGGQADEFDRLRKAYQEALACAELPAPCAKCGGSGKLRVQHGWTAVELPCDGCS